MPKGRFSRDYYGFRLLLRATAVIEYSLFPQFNKLAVELQHMIWKFAVASHGSRTVRVKIKDMWSKERSELWGSGRWREAKASTDVPALLRATHDSRQVALRRWHLTFKHHLRHQPVYFDWNNDVLHFEKPAASLWFHMHHTWNYRSGDEWDAEIIEVEENLKYVAVGIKSYDPRYNHAELRHRCHVPSRYKNLQAFFLCSGADTKCLLSKTDSLKDYFQNFNILILHPAWVDLFRRHMKRGCPPYTILVPKEEVTNRACIKWIEMFGSR